jgi:hypothetical protein
MKVLSPTRLQSKSPSNTIISPLLSQHRTPFRARVQSSEVADVFPLTTSTLLSLDSPMEYTEFNPRPPHLWLSLFSPWQSSHKPSAVRLASSPPKSKAHQH